MSRVKLFEIQEQALAAEDAHRAEHPEQNRLAVVLPTGSGKTSLFCERARRFVAERLTRPEWGPHRVLILVHTDELTDQAEKRARFMCEPYSVGVVKADRDEVDADIIVASVQTLSVPGRKERITDVGYVIVDECFPAGTMVGASRIEDLRVGDLVPSWDEASGKEVLAPVVTLMRKIPSSMVRVLLEDGTSFACTPNHPIMTTDGWCSAGELPRTALVVSFTHDEVTDRGALHGMRRPGSADREKPDRGIQEERTNLLPHGVQGRVGGAGQFGAHDSNPSEARQPDDGFGPAQQSHAASRDQGKGLGDAEADQAQAEGPWRKWKTSPSASGRAGDVPGLAHRGHRRAGRRAEAVSLQDRRGASDDEGVRGGGRPVTQHDGPPRLRPAPGRKTVETRVVGVQVLEPGSDGTYGGVCPDGAVYNIEVAGTHTYLIGDGLVVHNCQYGVTPMWTAALTHFGCVGGPVPMLGVTATLARSDGQGFGDLIHEMVYSRSTSWAIRKGYLIDVIPYTIKIPEIDAGASDARLDAQLADSIAPDAVVDAWFKEVTKEEGDWVGWDRLPSTVLFAPLVKSAQAFADCFESAGVKAEVVHGAMPKAERKAVLERYEAGTTTVVCNAMALTVGWDSPRTMCVIVARPTKSVPLFIQMVGRGLRPWLSAEAPPREEQRCVLLCVSDGVTELACVADLSDRPGEPSDGKTLTAMEDEWDLGRDIEPDGTPYAGPVVVERWDAAVQASSKAWKYTVGGIPFLPTAKRRSGYVFVVGTERGWETWARELYPLGGHSPAHRVAGLGIAPDLELAMALAEDEAEARGGDIGRLLADKNRAWRKAVPSVEMQEYAQRLGINIIPIMENRKGGKAGKLSDLIDKVVASRVIDPVAVKIKERVK